MASTTRIRKGKEQRQSILIPQPNPPNPSQKLQRINDSCIDRITELDSAHHHPITPPLTTTPPVKTGRGSNPNQYSVPTPSTSFQLVKAKRPKEFQVALRGHEGPTEKERLNQTRNLRPVRARERRTFHRTPFQHPRFEFAGTVREKNRRHPGI